MDVAREREDEDEDEDENACEDTNCWSVGCMRSRKSGRAQLGPRRAHLRADRRPDV